MTLDVYTHILPRKYYRALEKKASQGNLSLHGIEPLLSGNPALMDLDLRDRMLAEHPDMKQVITLVGPPLETIAKPEDAVDLAKTANDELAEIVERYPDKFAAAVALLPLRDIEAAMLEIDRALTDLHLRGIQIYTDINRRPLDAPELMPVYEKMAQYDLPIFIHPNKDAAEPDYPGEQGSRYQLNATIGWPHATTLAMMRLAYSGVLEKFPALKIITHHSGGTVPYLAERIAFAPYKSEKLIRPVTESLRLFYADTAVQGNTPNLMCAYAFFGADRLLFGTDFPLSNAHLVNEVIRSVKEMDITDRERNDILEGNARRLLKV